MLKEFLEVTKQEQFDGPILMVYFVGLDPLYFF